MKKNYIKKLLKNKQPIAVPEINRIFAPEIIELLGNIGYKCLWIDMEHSKLSYDCLSTLLIASRVSKMDVVIRISKGNYSSIIKPLELGASGLVLPHCMSANEAREFVRMAKFTPLGLRCIGAGIDSDYGFNNLKNYIKSANREILLMVQIEDKEAIEEIDDIASIKGIDGLFIGPTDLSQSLNVLGDFKNPKIMEIYEKVNNACKKNNKFWGVPAGEPGEIIQDLLTMGAQFINISSPINVIYRTYTKYLEDLSKQFGRFFKEK